MENKVTVTPEEIKRVKGLGFLQCKGTDNFNCRVITRNGKISAQEAKCITEGAEKFGNGEMVFTTRLTVEIQCVPYENIDPLIAHLKSGGLSTGGTGKKVRPIVSCKGTTCQYGLYDTYGISEKIHTLFYEGYRSVTLPHKFKIAVGGCPNNCVKPSLNDLGIMGQRIPGYDASKCKGCKVCQMEKACPMGAAKVADGVMNIDQSICTRCGRCVGKCIFHSNDESTYGYKVFIGGRWGKKSAEGKAINHLFTSEDELFRFIEKTILFFKEKGLDGERFADTIQRIGFENVEEELLSDAILDRKDEILSK